MIINPSPLHLQCADFSGSDESMLESIEKHLQHSRKRVRFFPQVIARETLHLNDYADDEVALVWYTHDDFDLMRRDRKETLALIHSGKYPGDDAHRCARGLERELRTGSVERRRNKRSGWLAVLEEQSIQKQCAIFDAQSIAMAYITATRHCLEGAYEMAIVDALEAAGLTPRTASRKGVRTAQHKAGGLVRFFRKRYSP